MAILHGSWLAAQECYLFIWGETWRRIPLPTADAIPSIQPYPYRMETSELLETSRVAQYLKTIDAVSIATEIIALPTQLPDLLPLYSVSVSPADSVYLYPWQVEGICLSPTAAFQFLQSLPLSSLTVDSDFGADLRYWSHVVRWCLDLLARCKFLPSLEDQVANWQPLLDSATDQTRLLKFAKQMPDVCRMYQKRAEGRQFAVRSISFGDAARTQFAVKEEVSGKECQENNSSTRNPKPETRNPPTVNSQPSTVNPFIDLPLSPEELLRSFLGGMIDSQVRGVAAEVNQKVVTNTITLQPAVATWLNALSGESGTLQIALTEREALENSLKSWTAPLQYSLTEHHQFQTAFYLHPPDEGKKNWLLEYGLQAVDQPDFWVDAKTVWNHAVEVLSLRGRTIKHPQETLLRGLGLASKLYPILEQSLQQARPLSCTLTPQQVYDFLKGVVWRLTDSGLGVILPPSLANREGWASRLGLSIRAEMPKLKPSERMGLKNLLNFKWELSIGGQTISKSEFDRLVAKNTPLVEINGEWVELRESDIRSAKTFFASRKELMTLTLEDALRLSTGDTQMIEKLPVVNFQAGGKLEELLNALTNNRSLEAIAPPKTFQGELRPYQARGAGWLSFLERWGLGACLADDMGLGKTIEFIAFLLDLKEQNVLESPVLLICPTSVLGNWEREVKRFSPTLNVKVHHGDKRAKGKAFIKAVQNQDLVITSYALTYRDEKELQSMNWQGVVLDEAQNIKNSDAKQSKIVRSLNPAFRIALTGTPVENRLSELWSILEFLNPGYLGQKPFFQRRFAVPIEKYGDKESLQTLRSLVQPFILRRLKTDKDIIQDLPEKQENTVFCPLSKEQATLYQNAVDESLQHIDQADGIQRRGMILALLVRLKQICNHPVLFETKAKSNSKKTDHSEFIKPQYSGKLQRLNEMLEEVLSEGDRALIFTQFAEWGKLLQPYLQHHFKREILFLYGSVRKSQREEMVDRFQHDPQGPPILILSLKAGGVGLNLTRANHVFHFDRWWNPAVENQATDRVFRIGQTRNVQVHKFVCTGTLEEKINDLIESKKALAEQVVSAGENWLTELDTDQLRNLLILDRNSIIDEEE